jgi:hypothetical protein
MPHRKLQILITDPVVLNQIALTDNWLMKVYNLAAGFRTRRRPLDFCSIKCRRLVEAGGELQGHGGGEGRRT